MKPRHAGFTLPTVLFALLLLAAVVSGAYVAALQSVRFGRLALSETTVRLAASSRMARALGTWDVSWDSLRVGSASMTTHVSGAIVETLQVRRTGTNVFAVASSARDSVFGGRRQLLGFARLDPLSMHPAAAVRVRVPLDPALRATIDSIDRVCSDTVTTVTLQSSADDSLFYRFGTTWDWPRLVSWIQGLPAGGDSLEWRFEPAGASLIGASFSGVLVVDGDLVLQQSKVSGIVIVRGAIRLKWPGAAISGVVVADAITLDAPATASAVRIDYSSCAVHLAGRSRAPARGLPGVPPADVF